ncbi:Tyrosyl-DNA phosphodiesterase [Penicillium griseofulvum]|uniref:D-malate dehydrogenase (decarboxylating) n=1 Tax=Penicillium patulum TaxID=5078 RepID=A0A135LYY4_PENPA|nr:Tyrosyl-DNA phosphodiesterase [Penicillium griseofulvum]KXG54169.1 Tyrosyl-DNA phosphodiesterase [Penicillium griseofulvum]
MSASQNTYSIASIPADGIGPEVIDAGITVLNALTDTLKTFKLDFKNYDWSSETYKKTGKYIPDGGLEELKKHDAIFFGAVGAPDVPDHISLWGLRLAICQTFQQYANVRPTRVFRGTESPLRKCGPNDLDWVIIRENSEGEYAGQGGRSHAGKPWEVATEVSIFSRHGVERIMRFAFETAQKRPRKLLTVVTKSNAQRNGMVLWDEVAKLVAADFPDVTVDKMLVDAMTTRMVLKPESLDTIVATNLHADILSDLAASLAGSIGIAPTSNLDPTREYPSMFEPIHGSAFDITGMGIPNPVATFWTAAEMLAWLGEEEASKQLLDCVENVCEQGVLTRDLGGNATTKQVTDAVVEEIKKLAIRKAISPPLPRGSPRLADSGLTPGPEDTVRPTKIVNSPVQLTHIRDLSNGNNVDTIRLRDILGDPMIRECWQFNFLFDVDFLMSQFDEDVRGLVQVKVVHGSWRREDSNRIRIEETCSRYPNVEPIVAYMPEPFGTHHSKMMILLRHDDLAQVVIHTANMIAMDWTNMTQAAWCSPLLPLERISSAGPPTGSKIGSGARFKRDLLTYLKAYGPKKTGPLVQQLDRYDFGAIRAALIASVPSKKHISDSSSEEDTLWGWPALKDLMSQIPIRQKTTGKKPHIVIQTSSVATLGQTNKWLKDVFFKALNPTTQPTTYSIIFPTPDEIRRSLDGYNSGGSIHMKTQSAAQQKQLQYMRPYLCQWAGDSIPPNQCIDLSEDSPPRREAGRARAAPHIKTYIRFADADMKTLDWAMVSSANLSTQAWGANNNSSGEVRICSWEIGIVVWPELFRDGGCDDVASASASESLAEGESLAPDALMVPCFKRDRPAVSEEAETASVVVGFRMPYDLPLTPYGAGDEPWCATASHHLPDWQGQSWIV